MGQRAEHPLRAANFVLGAVAVLAPAERLAMRQAVIADPMALGVGALGTRAALGVGEFLSDNKESRAYALGAEHVEDVVGHFGLGPVVEAERDFHFSSTILWAGAAGLHRGPASLDCVGRSAAPAYFFCSIGAPQHFIAPAPPLVTITCEPHLPQM